MCFWGKEYSTGHGREESVVVLDQIVRERVGTADTTHTLVLWELHYRRAGAWGAIIGACALDLGWETGGGRTYPHKV